MHRAILAAAGAFAVLAFTAPPAAAVQTTLWTTQIVENGADVAVGGPGGVAHVVWVATPPFPGERMLHYCRLPRGAASCFASAQFPIRDELAGGPSVLVAEDGNRVTVVHGQSRGSVETIVRVSNDGGETFGSAFRAGEGAADEYVFGPGDAVSGAGQPAGGTGADANYWDFPLNGLGNNGDRAAIVNGQNPGNHGRINGWNTAMVGGTPIFTYQSLGAEEPIDNAQVWAFRWSGNGSIRDGGQWQPPIRVGRGAVSDVASGPAGTAFIYARNTESRFGPASIRATTLDSLGTETTVATDELRDSQDSQFGSIAAWQGGFVAAWSRSRLEADGTWQDIRISRSPNGRDWSPPVTIECDRGIASRPQVAVHSDGLGEVVYTYSPPTTDVEQQVRIVGFGVEPREAEGCTPDSPAGPGAGGVQILSRSATVARRTGKFKLKLRCRGASPCTGRIGVRSLLGRRLGTSGSGRYRVGADRRATANARMNATGLGTLRARRRLSGVVTLTPTEGGRSVRRTVTLKISR